MYRMYYTNFLRSFNVLSLILTYNIKHSVPLVCPGKVNPGWTSSNSTKLQLNLTIFCNSEVIFCFFELLFDFLASFSNKILSCSFISSRNEYDFSKRSWFSLPHLSSKRGSLPVSCSPILNLNMKPWQYTVYSYTTHFLFHMHNLSKSWHSFLGGHFPWSITNRTYLHINLHKQQ